MAVLNNSVRNILLAVGALALIGVLFFLYEKTHAVDASKQNEVLGLLRELKDIDNRWDADVLRARLEPTAAAVPLIDRSRDASKALQDLAAAGQATGSAAIAAALPELQKSINEKGGLVTQFENENRGAREALDAVLQGSTELRQANQKSLLLEQALRTLTGVAQQYYLLAQDSQRSTLEIAAGQLINAPLPAPLHERATQLDDAVQALLKHTQAQQKLSAQLGLLTSGPRLDSATFAFNSEVEATLTEKERFRVYLVAYAGALLILIGWLGGKLRTANISLEQRVEERTRELSDALRHLKESEAQLIQSEKMSSLGQMVAGVAHEINTPLAYVKNSLGTVAEQLPGIDAAIGNTEKLLGILQTGAGADPQALSQQFTLLSGQISHLRQQHVLEELSGLVNDGLYGTGQMVEIVGNLKDFSRLDRSKVTHFNLNDGLNSTLTLARHLLKSLTIEKKFGEIPEIVCSPSQINQVFLNLITNAAQAMADGKGTITLTTQADGNGVLVEVRDNGKGIPADVLPKIFDPFFTTKEAGKGTGLGLSISYKIVQDHGGRIEVESKPNVGTRFRVWLPLTPPVEARLAGATA
jgi:signal transduction histidine kinase